ncbi:MAG TPA: hypothetical protein VL022_05045, partial [Moheibacter sp.]|nr:hypothetical protein [Moheibacter sp.]
MNNYILRLFCLFTFLYGSIVYADGSRDLYPSGKTGHRAFLRSTSSTTGTIGIGAGDAYPYANRGTHYVYAKAGETILLASSAQGFGTTAAIRYNNREKIQLYGPNGVQITLNVGTTATSNGNNVLGNIGSRTQELAGPSLTSGGTLGTTGTYKPIEYTVPVGGDGVYLVHFLALGTNDPNNSSVLANSNWTQGSSANIAAWDVSIRSNTTLISGRVYFNTLGLSTGNYGTNHQNERFYGIFYAMTKDGYYYRINNNGVNGVFWQFYVNNFGFVNNANTETGQYPLYRSLNTNSATDVRIPDPNVLDTKVVTHKIFYTLPSQDLPLTAEGARYNTTAPRAYTVGAGTTWLRNPNVIEPEVIDANIVGVEGIANMIGKKGGVINFNSTTTGIYNVKIHIPAIGFVRDLAGTANIGSNSIYWDGKNNAGVELPRGNHQAYLRVTIQTGEVHFPFLDVEYNTQGIIIDRIELNPVNNLWEEKGNTVYWDDRDVTPWDTNWGSNPRTNLEGSSSFVNGHLWNIRNNDINAQFGNSKALDTWTYVKNEDVDIPLNLMVKEADLAITSVTPDKTSINLEDEITYTVKVKNNGPDDAEGATFTFKIPEGVDPINIIFNGNGCGTESIALVYDAATRTYTSTLDLPNGCEITYDIIVKANNPPFGALEVEAGILRPNDTFDPDATNTNPNAPIGTAQEECQNNGQGGVCNNVNTNNSVVFSIDHCFNGDCNPNTYVNSNDPNTIEYDNIVSVFHSSMIREADGTVKIWGAGTRHNGSGTSNHYLVPMEVNSTNYPLLTGKVLKFAAASNVQTQQFAVLTTDGLFTWGNQGILIPASLQTAGTFKKQSIGTYGVTGTKADGLPNGVKPEDVKMMFGTYQTLAIITCTGDAWVLSQNGNLYGDGATDNNTNDAVWHRVTTSEAGNPLLNGVVAVRGTLNGLMALTSTGEIYTWGTGVRLGDNTAAANRTHATKMTLPTGVTPKMIGMTRSNDGLTHYVLATDGHLYALGENGMRQLGNGGTADSNVWIQVIATSGTNTLGGNIVWISPQEHEGGDYPAINILTDEKKLWAWGGNNGNMIGGTNTGSNNPMYMPGSVTGAYNAGKLNLDDTLIAVETGGHTTLTIKENSSKFGYVGHRTNGSMANGSTGTGNDSEYNFAETSNVLLCGAETGEEICYKPGMFDVDENFPTKIGISSLRMTESTEWPSARQGAWIALEAKTKGFVPNRLTQAQVDAIPAANLVKGMMVYNSTEDC